MDFKKDDKLLCVEDFYGLSDTLIFSKDKIYSVIEYDIFIGCSLIQGDDGNEYQMSNCENTFIKAPSDESQRLLNVLQDRKSKYKSRMTAAYRNKNLGRYHDMRVKIETIGELVGILKNNDLL